jgi:uncharacterized membrane protein YciS (DUF1049 family)
MIEIAYFVLGFGVAWGIATFLVMKQNIEREKFLRKIGLLKDEDV